LKPEYDKLLSNFAFNFNLRPYSLVLWGNLLWDVRLPHPVQRFDRFSDGGGACFHPTGNEVILNSEVWDLRSDRLLRSVPGLDGTQLSWWGSGVHT